MGLKTATKSAAKVSLRKNTHTREFLKMGEADET